MKHEYKNKTIFTKKLFIEIGNYYIAIGSQLWFFNRLWWLDYIDGIESNSYPTNIRQCLIAFERFLKTNPSKYHFYHE